MQVKESQFLAQKAKKTKGKKDIPKWSIRPGESQIISLFVMFANKIFHKLLTYMAGCITIKCTGYNICNHCHCTQLVQH